MRTGRQAEAHREAQQFVERYPDNPQARSALAHVLMAMGEYHAADEAAAAATSLGQDEPAFHFLRARTRFALSDYEAAYRETVIAAQQAHNVSDAYYYQSCALLAAACQVELGLPDAARNILNQVDDTCTLRTAGKVLTKASVTEAATRLVFGRALGS
jgi:predicted Zn-dependent protease